MPTAAEAAWQVLERWRIVDRWWTEEPQVREFADVKIGDRRYIFRREDYEPVWRVVGSST